MQRVKILIEVVDRAQVPEMPKKSRLVCARAGRNRRHDHIAAIAGVSRNGEMPCRVRSSRAAQCAGHHERGGPQRSSRRHAVVSRTAGSGAVGFGDDLIGIGAILHSIGSAMPSEHPRDLWWASAERERVDNWTREIGQPASLAARGALEIPYRFPRRLPTSLRYIGMSDGSDIFWSPRLADLA